MTKLQRVFLETIAVHIALYGAESQTISDEDAIAAEDYARSLGIEVRQPLSKVAGA